MKSDAFFLQGLGILLGVVVATCLMPKRLNADDNPFQQRDRVEKVREDFVKARAETEKQLAQGRAEMEKAKQAIDIAAREKEIEEKSNENLKEAPEGIKSALQSAISGGGPIRSCPNSS